MPKGKLLVLSGPSGAGKSTVVARLMTMRDDVCFSVSATTRAPRPGEVDGVNYFFVTRERFDEMVRENALLEHAEYVGNFYGTPKEFVDTAMEAGRDVILEIDVQGALQVAAKRPEAILIFIAPPSWEELERRLTLRGTDSPEKIQKRLLRAKVECQTADAYHYFVINDTLENAAAELDAIMTAEHCKSRERMEIINGN